MSIRRSESNGRFLIVIYTAERQPEVIRGLVEEVLKKTPGVQSIVNGVTARVADTSEGAEYFVEAGEGYIVENLQGMTFRLFPSTFFQPNTHTAQVLAGHVRQAVGQGGKNVLDLYCGVGTLGILVAPFVDQVVGLELNPESIHQAISNARDNGISNTEFRSWDLNQGLPEIPFVPETLIADPPRAGMHERVVQQILAWSPRTIVSVGCNPITQARNIAQLVGGGYTVDSILAVDQFPQTPEVECVVHLRRS